MAADRPFSRLALAIAALLLFIASVVLATRGSDPTPLHKLVFYKEVVGTVVKSSGGTTYVAYLDAAQSRQVVTTDRSWKRNARPAVGETTTVFIPPRPSSGGPADAVAEVDLKTQLIDSFMLLVVSSSLALTLWMGREARRPPENPWLAAARRDDERRRQAQQMPQIELDIAERHAEAQRRRRAGVDNTPDH